MLDLWDLDFFPLKQYPRRCPDIRLSGDRLFEHALSGWKKKTSPGRGDHLVHSGWSGGSSQRVEWVSAEAEVRREQRMDPELLEERERRKPSNSTGLCALPVILFLRLKFQPWDLWGGNWVERKLGGSRKRVCPTVAELSERAPPGGLFWRWAQKSGNGVPLGGGPRDRREEEGYSLRCPNGVRSGLIGWAGRELCVSDWPLRGVSKWKGKGDLQLWGGGREKLLRVHGFAYGKPPQL